MAQTSIVAEEAERFGKLAGDWWNPNGASAMLHRLNPVRLKYIRDQVDQHWEVIEHVADPAVFVQALAKRVAPGGLLILSTPNATGWSKLLMITIGEGVGRIPRGTHDFDKFISPDRMKVLLCDAGLKCLDVEGIAWSPTRGLHLSDDLRLNYLVAAVSA